MELIVKIGEDQQGLRDTIQRITTAFKNMNTSVPSSWSAHMPSMQNYGKIMQSANTAGFSFTKLGDEIGRVSPTLGALAGRMGALASPLGVLGGVAIAAAAGVKIAIGELKDAAALARQSRITGFSASMLKNIGQAAGRTSMTTEEAMTALNRMNANAGSALAGNKEARGMFGELGVDPAGMSSDDLLRSLKTQFAGITDPAKRARLSKGIFGRGAFEMSELLAKLETETTVGENRDVQQLANTWGRFKKWRSNATRETGKFITGVAAALFGSGGGMGEGVSSQTIGADAGESAAMETERRKGAEEAVKAEAQYKKDYFNRLSPEMKLGYMMVNTIPQAEARLAGAASGSSEFFEAKNALEQARFDYAEIRAELAKKNEGKAEKMDGLTFQADALAQAGLFAGSSLLFNPNFSIQQQQLEVLRRIEGNTSKGGIFG